MKGWVSMPCLIALLALITPRITFLVIVIASDYIGDAFISNLWPFLGFFLMPLTTLAYAFAINSNGGVTGYYLLAVIIAVMIDLGLLGGSSRASRRRKRRRARKKLK
jgi:hypothetical protein